MKITNFLFICVTLVLAVLLGLEKCKTNPVQVTTNHSIESDNLRQIIRDLTLNKKDTLRIDTIYKTKIVYLTKSIPVPQVVYIDTTKSDSVSLYTYANGQDDVVVLDSIQVRGEILSHKQEIHITEKETQIVATETIPIIDTVTITEYKVYRDLQLRVGATYDFNEFMPTIALNTKLFTVTLTKSLLDEKAFVSLLIPVTKKKIKRSKR